MDDNQRINIVSDLSYLIAGELSAFSSEYWQPKFAADQMDAELKFRKERIEGLRTMRKDFENLMFGLERDVV